MTLQSVYDDGLLQPHRDSWDTEYASIEIVLTDQI